jgi:TPR repeat protein
MVRTATILCGAGLLVSSQLTGCGGAGKKALPAAPATAEVGFWIECDQPDIPVQESVVDCQEMRGLGNAPLTADEPISRACAERDSAACRVRGKLACAAGLAVEPESLRFAFLENACDQNEPASCEALGQIFADDDELDSAHAAFSRGCEYGSTSSCLKLGQLLKRGEGCDRNRKMAVHLFEQTCMRGESRGCTLAADMYRQGWGVAFSPARAADLYQQACNTDNPRACRKLSELYRSGTGVAQSDSEANELLTRACSMGSPNACDDLRRRQEKTQPEQPTGSETTEVAAPVR